MPKSNKAPTRAQPRRDVALPITRYDIKTAYGLIEAFGGADGTAKLYGVPAEHVNEWAVSGFIPNGWHLRIFGRVCAMGKTISPTVFGFDEHDEEALALSRLMMQGGANV